ncbi:MAG: HAD-IIA family hydrolase [Anaerolineaceae bacterium]|nr:HAD-IIA family hydrolase [Anaerolineaceae bacterium]
MMKTIKIKALIFDMDGVLWSDQTPIVDLDWVFKQLNQYQISYAFATNNSTKTPFEYCKKLNHFNVKVNEDHIFTSGTTLVKMLKEKYPTGGPVHILGENGLREPLTNSGFYQSDQNILAVVGGLDRQITYEKLKNATLQLQNNVDFYYTNADSTFPTPEGKIPGAGSILAALVTASGKKAILAGKPEPMMFEHTISLLNTTPESTLIIGDRIDTDILGGIRANCKTALVLSGISSESDLMKFSYKPDLVHKNLVELVNFLISKNWGFAQ